MVIIPFGAVTLAPSIEDACEGADRRPRATPSTPAKSEEFLDTRLVITLTFNS